MSKSSSVDRDHDAEPLKFTSAKEQKSGQPAPAVTVADDALAAIESMSRKIDDLARELNCLGFFTDDDDRPRAA